MRVLSFSRCSCSITVTLFGFAYMQRICNGGSDLWDATAPAIDPAPAAATAAAAATEPAAATGPPIAPALAAATEPAPATEPAAAAAPTTTFRGRNEDRNEDYLG